MVDKYVAIIPVRGGSKSLPLKNIRPICGRPLVWWTMDAALGCDEIDKVYISTDSEAIKGCVEQYIQKYACKDRLLCFDRDPSTATDTATTESAMIDFASKIDFENIILIQATSPLLQTKHLKEAIKKYETEKYDSLLSVVRQKRFIWEETDKGARSVNYDYQKRPRRQDYDGYLVENGAFYIESKKLLMETKCRLGGKIGTYEMDEETYYEIDEPSDWFIIEQLMKQAKLKFGLGIIGKDIKLLATDCDGIMTDAGMYYTEHGDEIKKFNARDGMAFELLRNNGIKTAIITKEKVQIVENRAKKIKADYLYQGAINKIEILNELAKKENISLENIVYLGDDINDVECLKSAGLGITVKDATIEAQQSADIVLDVKGGSGAVRAAAEIILKK